MHPEIGVAKRKKVSRFSLKKKFLRDRKGWKEVKGKLGEPQQQTHWYRTISNERDAEEKANLLWS